MDQQSTGPRRMQFSLRVLLIVIVVISFGLAAYSRFHPRLGPQSRSHIDVSFSKTSRGEKVMVYHVRILSDNGQLYTDEYGDVDPCDGQLDCVLTDVMRAGGRKYFSNTPMFAGPPPTARMLAVYAKIFETIKEPMKAHNVIWLDKSSPDRTEFERIRRSGEDRLIVPLPDTKATRDAFRVVDDSGNPLP